MKRGDLVICRRKSSLNYAGDSWSWEYTEHTGIILQVKKSTSSSIKASSNIYLVKLHDGQQLYFYDDYIRLDKVRMRQNILNELGI